MRGRVEKKVPTTREKQPAVLERARNPKVNLYQREMRVKEQINYKRFCYPSIPYIVAKIRPLPRATIKIIINFEIFY